jgi:hypothetical protein
MQIMTLRKLLLPVLAVLLLSSASMRRAAQGQTTATGLSGSWIGVANLPPGLNNGPGGNTSPLMLTCNPNGTVTLVRPQNGNGSDIVAVGSWVSTADAQFALTVNQFNYDNDGNFAGLNKIRISLNVSAGQMSGNAELVASDATGALLGIIPGITFTATPIAVETIGSM